MLVGDWKLDEDEWNGTNGEVKDSSGLGNNGTAINGATTQTGIVGNAGSFNENDYVTCGNDDSLDVGDGNFTVSLYAKRPKTDEVFSMVSKQEGQTGWDFQILYWDGLWRMKLYSPNVPDIAYLHAFTADEWYYLTAVRDQYSGIVKYYINGEYKASVNYTTNDLSSDGDLIIGTSSYGTLQGYKGLLDEVRLYNHILSENEIFELYNSTKPEEKENETKFGDVCEVSYVPHYPEEYKEVNVTVKSKDPFKLVTAVLYVNITREAYTAAGAFAMIKIDNHARYHILNGYAAGTVVSFHINVYNGLVTIASPEYSYTILNETEAEEDSDEDGLPDFWETKFFGTLFYGPEDDPDDDGFTNLQEYEKGTDPMYHDYSDDDINPEDTDGDGLPDVWEMDNFGDLSHDHNGDDDGDGFTNLQEYLNGTDPTDPKDLPGDPILDDDDDDDSISTSDVFFTLGMALALIIILGCITFAIVSVLVMRKRSQEEEDDDDRIPEGELPPEEDLWATGGQVGEVYDDPQDEWSDLEHSQESDEGYINDLEDEALQFEKPSDFELSTEDMLDRLKERHDSGEIDQTTYGIIYEALQGDNIK